MSEYNKIPNDMKLISSMLEYKKFQNYFTYCFEDIEFRQIPYDKNDLMKGFYSVRIFWIKKECDLGYCISDNWKNKTIDFNIIGKDEDWLKFKRGFASQFAGDNS